MKQGWEECNLEDYIKLIDYRGRTPVKTESGVRLITAKNVKLGYLQLDPQEFINSNNYDSWMSRGIPNFGDVIFTTEAPLANVAQIDTKEKLAFAQRIIVMQPKANKIDQTFLKYMLLSENVRQIILEKGTGATVLGIKSSLLKKVKISFPSLPEQYRIVSILDKAFAAIATAKANAEQNIKNVKELFESYLQGVFEDGNWENVKLSELAKDITDGDHMPPPKSEEGFPFITISNINKQNHQIDFSDTFKVPKEYFYKLKENRKPKKGDVLYTVTGSYGIPVLIENDFEFCFQRHIGLIRPKVNVYSRWLYYWILSPQAIFQANDTATGTAQKTVSLTALRNFVLPKMTLKEQQTIITKLDALSAETKKLEAIYRQKVVDLDEFKKSLLQKAFNGKLSN